MSLVDLKISIVFATVVLTLLISSCVNSGDKKDDGPVTVYNYPCSYKIATLDPAVAQSQTEDSIVGEIFDTLITYDQNLNLIPDLAESWDYDPEKAVYTFNLKRGVKFHNGEEMTAQDVIFSFTRLADKSTDSPWTDWILLVKGAGDFRSKNASEISGLRAIDDHTVEIELRRIHVPFINILANNAFSIIPQNVYENGDVAPGDFPIGSGPFKYEKTLDDGSVSLLAFDDYHMGRPSLDGILFRLIEDQMEMISEYKKGNLDHIWIFPDLAEKILADESIPGRIESYPMNAIYFYAFNLDRRQFGGSHENKRLLRQALNFAIDRELICSDVFKGRCIPMKSAFADGILGYENPMMERLGFHYDMDKTLELIDIADCNDGSCVGKVSLYTTYESHNVAIAEIVRDKLSEIGFDVEIVAKDKENYMLAVREGDSALFSYEWYMSYPDFDDLFGMFHSANAKEGGDNIARMTRENIDILIDQARRENDPEERKKIYMDLETQLVFDSPWLFMFRLKNAILVQDNVTGLSEQLCQFDYNEAISHVRMEAVDKVLKKEE